MKRIKDLSPQGPMLLFASVFCLLQLGISPQASAQTTQTDVSCNRTWLWARD